MYKNLPQTNAMRNTLEIPTSVPPGKRHQIEKYYFVGNGTGTDDSYVLVGLAVQGIKEPVILTLAKDAVLQLTNDLEGMAKC